MEANEAISNLTDYLADNVTDKLIGNITDNGTVIYECKSPLEKSALFEFIVNGILLNLIGLFGLFGNFISMIILSRPQMKSSINYLLIGLARCDTILIITSILCFGLPAIYYYTGFFFTYKFVVYPKIVKFLYPLLAMTQMVTVYLTVTVTMERYVAVCHPLRARSLCTYGRARLAVLCIILFAFVYNLQKFWEVDFETEVHWKYNVTIYCIVPTQLRSNLVYLSVVNWMYFVFYYELPFAFLVIFNHAIYQQVRKANRDLQHLSRHQRREIGLAVMLLCVVIVFIICNILPLATNIYENFRGQPPNWMVQLGNLMVTINSSVNFIIYVIFGRKFKRIFLRLFCGNRFFGPGRDSPEFQTNDESVTTNTTNIELRNSIRRSHLQRSNTTISRNNNVLLNGNSRQSVKGIGRSASPGPCVYYPARSPVRSPSQLSRTSSAQNGWTKSDMADTPLQ
ncbi:FMRFamide receptor [Cephus cinctus]|uniref:FMRFamide receptor n=1 Tax=Cephus cinctus TaxID=211228 RepID=A0AAJ7BP78_CEPCN|nr:FMRFamide receptor [Cephus cinctus]XP_015591026.1 FMRFamide receptor [Cephus cinctus]